MSIRPETIKEQLKKLATTGETVEGKPLSPEARGIFAEILTDMETLEQRRTRMSALANLMFSYNPPQDTSEMQDRTQLFLSCTIRAETWTPQEMVECLYSTRDSAERHLALFCNPEQVAKMSGEEVVAFRQLKIVERAVNFAIVYLEANSGTEPNEHEPARSRTDETGGFFAELKATFRQMFS